MGREKELWGMAYWVERTHGDKGYDYIEGRIEHFRELNDHGGVKLWKKVESRLLQLRAGPVMIYGQPETWPN